MYALITPPTVICSQKLAELCIQRLPSSARPGYIWQPEQHPELASSGCQNSSQNCPVLAARTAARAAVLARTVLSNWQHSSGRTRQFWQKIPQPEHLNWLCKSIRPVTRTKFWQCRYVSEIAPKTIQRASKIISTW